MLKAWGDEWSTEMGSGLPFMGLVALLVHLVQMLMTLTIGLFIDKVSQALSTIDPETIDEDFALITQQDIQDVLVCFFDENGILPPEQYGDLIDAIAAKIPENQGWYLIRMFVEMIGFVGVTLAAKIAGITEAECESCCDWEHTFDFTVGSNGFSNYNTGGLTAEGWESVFLATGPGDIQIVQPYREGLAPFDLREATWETYYDGDGGLGDDANYLHVNGGFELANLPPIGAGIATYHWSGVYDGCTRLHLGLSTYDTSTVFYVRKLTICGMGENPFA
jgi:hypothetical protein